MDYASPMHNNPSGSQPEGGDMAWDYAGTIEKIVVGHELNAPQLRETVQNLQATLENSALAYNRAIDERNAKREALARVENTMAKACGLIQVYAKLQDIVVASDGLTYDGKVIGDYIRACQEASVKAYSEETKEELTENLIPNRSLSRLISLILDTPPKEVPAATPFPMINLNDLHPHPQGMVMGEMPHPSVGHDNMPMKTMRERDLWGRDDLQGMPPRRPYAEAAATASKQNELVPRSNADPMREMEERRKGPGAPRQLGDSMMGRGGRGAGEGHRGGRGGRGPAEAPATHPCLRIFGFCSYQDDCTFAKYPYEACLNNIKGKCRYSTECRELHIDPEDIPKYENNRSNRSKERGPIGFM